MADLTTFRLQGQTHPGAVAITTVNVVLTSDGNFKFTPTGQQPVIIDDPNAMRLLGKVFNIKTTGYPSIAL
jgi:hypothetical protein